MAIVIMISYAQELPLGYILQYSQDFSGKKALADFDFLYPDYCSISGNVNNYFLELSENTGYADSTGRPDVLAIISTHMYSDFIMELDVLPSGKEYDNNIYLLYGFKDTSNYYYIYLASDAGNNSNNIFMVHRSVLTKIGTDTTGGINRSNNKWHRVKVIRDILEKSLTVYIDNMTNPAIKVKDRTLIMGYIGFGSAGNAARIDNINIWAPTTVPGDTIIFEKTLIPAN